MTPIFRNRGLATRMNISCVVIGFAALFGCWELWSAYGAGQGAGTNMLFAFFFIGGAVYAGKQIRDGSLDSVVSLDADMATREASVVIWRPFSKVTLAGPLDRLTDWQFQMKGKGRVRTPILTAHHPDYPRPLEFELTKATTPLSRELKALAPDAVAAFERAGGH